MPALKTHLVKIGNSYGIRIPKAIIQQINLIGEVEIEVRRDCLIIKPAENPRAGWVEMFKKAIAKENEAETSEWVTANLNDDEEWTWK
jgi:antitoxin MazE